MPEAVDRPRSDIYANEKLVITQADMLGKLPDKMADPNDGGTKSVTFPLLVLGQPITRGAREIALQRRLNIIAEEFVDWDRTTQNWTPWNLPSLGEVKELGGRKEEKHEGERGGLSPETITLWDAFAKTELRVGDYTSAALEINRSHLSRKLIAVSWGGQESLHAYGTTLLPVIAGVMTELDMVRVREEAMEHKWDARDHLGLDDPWGYTYFGGGQEYQTVSNYRKLYQMLRADYGLPAQWTEEERRRGYAVGMCDFIYRVMIQENKHHSTYLGPLRAVIRYFPELAFDAMQKVDKGFNMPLVGTDLIPETEEAIIILYGSKRAAVRSLHKTLEHVNRAVGLSDRKSIKRAQEAASQLSDGPDSFGLLKPDGTIVPQGIAVPTL